MWCWLASRLSGHERVVRVIGRWGHWMVPVVFVAISLGILFGSGALTGIV